MTEQPTIKESLTQLSDKDLATISKLIRVLEGKPLEDDTIIKSLTNPKEILERSRFMTYPLLQKNVYLRLVATKHPELKSFREWANYEAKALISYKGEGRKEWVEQRKNTQQAESGTVIGSYTGQPQPQPKKRFWQRSPKPEKSEFINQ